MSSPPQLTQSRAAALADFLLTKIGEKRLFLLLIFILAALTIYDVTRLTVSYFNGPKEAKMSINFNDSIVFPNLTFCVTKNHAWSHFNYDRRRGAASKSSNETNSTPKQSPTSPLAQPFAGDYKVPHFEGREAFLRAPWQNEKMVMSAYHAIGILNYLEREWDASRTRHEIENFGSKQRLASSRALVQQWLEEIARLNITFAEFQDKVGKEVIRRSIMGMFRTYMQDDKEDLPTRVRITWISLRHLCFQPMLPNNTGFDAITDQGQFFKMMLRHNDANLRTAEGRNEGKKKPAGNETDAGKTKPNNNKVDVCVRERREDCMTVDFHGRPTVFARSMEGKGRVKDGLGEGLCPGEYVEVNAEVRAMYKMLPNEEKPTACRDYDDASDSEFLCRSRCRMQMIRELCSCTGHTFRSLADDNDLETYPLCDYEKCGANASSHVAKQQVTDQECAEKCRPDCQQIRYKVVVDRKGHSATSGSEATAVTQIFLIWGAFEYLKLDQDFKWDWASWSAALGGSMGMYLGLSALSLIQLFTWLAGKVPRKIGSKKSLSITSVPIGPNRQRSISVHSLGVTGVDGTPVPESDFNNNNNNLVHHQHSSGTATSNGTGNSNLSNSSSNLHIVMDPLKRPPPSPSPSTYSTESGGRARRRAPPSPGGIGARKLSANPFPTGGALTENPLRNPFFKVKSEDESDSDGFEEGDKNDRR